MKWITFGAHQRHTFPIALVTRLLIKSSLKDYVAGIEDDVVAYSITTPPKAKKAEILTYLAELLPTLCSLQVDYVMVTEAAVFKALTNAAKVEGTAGYVVPCVVKDFTHLNIVYVPDPRSIAYDERLNDKLQQGRTAIQQHRAGRYVPPGAHIIKTAHYLHDVDSIAEWLRKLVDTDLAADIETFSLKHYEAGIGTMALAWNQHEGIAFPVDKDTTPEFARTVRRYLREFFAERARRKTTRTYWHNGAFDCYVLIYQLFMTDLLDTAGLLRGLEVMMQGFEDTQLITYLATNTCAGNEIGLKKQAQEFAGNYAVDVKDIRVTPLPKLLEYNLVDALSTWYVKHKHWDTLVQDQQEPVYRDYFLPFTTDIIQTQLTGLPLDMDEVLSGEAEMELHRDVAISSMRASLPVKQLEERLRIEWADKMNAQWKKKRIDYADVDPTMDDVRFNPNSPPKLQKLLFEIMGLPVISYTDTKQPSTDGDTIEALIHHATDPNHKAFLQNLIEFKQVDKIIGTFIAAFKQAPKARDGWHYLFGFFKLGGTQSGRLSSHDPNMQNLPATGSKYAKAIKKMVKAPPGWLFVGLDFASLEDRISALTTKDPNKLKVYTDGYDGHSLRAYFYFGDRMPDIDPDSVDSINSIQKKYKGFRQDSKAPTFALTYMGTYKTLMTNCGFSKKQAEEIEAAYHRMYKVSDLWVESRIQEAVQCGYVTLAFGLRLRTPLLCRTILGNRATPNEAEAEKRSAGNALGQSYCLLNSRAANAFLTQVRASKYRLDIRPCAQIHDAQYYLVREDVNLVHWVNETLVPCVEWQELPEIQHDQVKLGGELSIFHPTWAHELTIPNGASKDQILTLAKEHMQ